MGYVEAAITNCHTQMAAHELADAHRRVFAAWVVRLAELALAWLEPTDSPAAWLRYCDLLGAGMYRADSTFYGQGAIAEMNIETEAGWRLSLMRARDELDHCSHILAFKELLSGEDEEIAEAESAFLDELSKVAHLQSDGSFRMETIRDPADLLGRLRDEVEYRVAVGRSKGWCAPSYPVRAPDAYEIEAWLCRRADSVVLCSVPGQPLALFFADASRVQRRILELGEQWTALLDSLQKFAEAHVTWMQASRGGPGDTSAARRSFDEALSSLLTSEAAVELGCRVHQVLAEVGAATLVVLTRGMALLPWEVCGRRARAHAGRDRDSDRSGSWGDVPVCRRGEMDPGLSFGWAAMRAQGPISGPLAREEFEDACQRYGVLRIFTHAQFHPFLAPLSTLQLSEGAEHPYKSHELALMDLTGCGRVELWACESGLMFDFLGARLGQDEPFGLGSYFLLAGAHVVVGAWWEQAGASAGLISAAFAVRAKTIDSASADARALADAVADYRRVVAESGAFESAVKHALLEASRIATNEGSVAEPSRRGGRPRSGI